MKASEAIQALKKIIDKEGDLEIYEYGSSEDYQIQKIQYKQSESKEYWPDCGKPEITHMPDRIVFTS
jgi:hypothetical protein